MGTFMDVNWINRETQFSLHALPALKIISNDLSFVTGAVFPSSREKGRQCNAIVLVPTFLMVRYRLFEFDSCTYGSEKESLHFLLRPQFKPVHNITGIANVPAVDPPLKLTNWASAARC